MHIYRVRACVRAGADEDVEAVMARLAAQSAENIALKERQAKLDKDQQVRAVHRAVVPTVAIPWVRVLHSVRPLVAYSLDCCLANTDSVLGNVSFV